jgi:hypothetical protein
MVAPCTAAWPCTPAAAGCRGEARAHQLQGRAKRQTKPEQSLSTSVLRERARGRRAAVEPAQVAMGHGDRVGSLAFSFTFALALVAVGGRARGRAVVRGSRGWSRGGRHRGGRRRVDRGGTAGVERVFTSGLLRAVLLQHEEGTGLQKGGKRHKGGEVRDRTMVLAPEPANQVEDLLRLRHGLAEVAQLVSEALEPRAVLHDAHVALDDGMVLGVDVDSVGEVVVAKEGGDGRPDRDSRVAGLHYDVEQLWRDGDVKPVGDGVVDHDPLRVLGAADDGGVDMIREAELIDDGAEEAMPLPVVAGGEVERDKDMGPDGDRLDHRGWKRGRGDAVLGAAPIAACRAGEPGGVLAGEVVGVTMGLSMVGLAEAWERGCEKGLSSSSSDTMKAGKGSNTICIDIAGL